MDKLLFLISRRTPTFGQPPSFWKNAFSLF
jgi:hypothetical protein